MNAKIEEAKTAYYTEITKSSTGCITLENGMIFQWGRTGNVGYDVTVTVNLPTPFTSSTSYKAFTLNFNSDASDRMIIYPCNQQTTYFQCYVLRCDNSNYGTRYVQWFAIGY